MRCAGRAGNPRGRPANRLGKTPGIVAVMRIHSAEIRRVRQFEELKLDLSAPLTVIGGPNGVGKTTLQEAILAAMFTRPKAMRDTFISQFDPGTPPTVALGLPHDDGAPPPSPTPYLL